MYSFNAEFCKQNSVLFCLPRPPWRLFLQHSKIRTGSIRKPPVSLLPLKNFFHADALFCIGCFLRQISKEPDKNAQRFFMLCKKGHAE